MPGTDGKAVSTILLDSYDLLYGSWPENYNEVVLVLNENNSIPAGTLYQLGLITGEELKGLPNRLRMGKMRRNVFGTMRKSADILFTWFYHATSIKKIRMARLPISGMMLCR